MAKAKQGDTVQVNYTGKLQDGTVFDTSNNRGPLQFTLGKGQLILGFEQAVIGMNTGEKKTVVIPPDQAYGPHRDENVVTVKRSFLPSDLNPKVGQRLEIIQENDQSILVTVADVSETSFTLDGNHPLAGRDLTFDIELVAVL